MKNSEFEPLYLFRSLASFVLELSCHSGGEIDVVRFLLGYKSKLSLRIISCWNHFSIVEKIAYRGIDVGM